MFRKADVIPAIPQKNGSFKTIPNALRQLPSKNLIMPEAPSRWAWNRKEKIGMRK